MQLGEIIEFLEKYSADTVVKYGWGEPHSYRGYYEDVAFDPATDTTVGAMLEHARSAVGATYEGYKGDYFTMSQYTDCWIDFAHRFRSIGISELLLRYMVNNFNDFDWLEG